MSVAWSSFVSESIDVNGITIDVLDIDSSSSRRGALKEMLFNDTIELVSQARGWLASQEKEHFRRAYKFAPMLRADYVFIARDQDRVVGLCSVYFMDCDGEPVIHLSNASMLPETQRKGIMTAIGMMILARCNAKAAARGRVCGYVTCITQNPVVYGLFLSYGTVYPRPPPSAAEAGLDLEPIKKVARFIAKEFNPDLALDEDNFVLRNECQFFYKDVPRHRDPSVNAFLDGMLRYEEGDVVVCVVKLNL